jgi:hypothetical protein
MIPRTTKFPSDLIDTQARSLGRTITSKELPNVDLEGASVPALLAKRASPPADEDDEEAREGESAAELTVLAVVEDGIPALGKAELAELVAASVRDGWLD